MPSRAEVAETNFRNGYNCAQAVLSAFEEDFWIDHKTLMAISRGFGGGVGQTGGICGAVTGAVMVIGLSTRDTVDNPEGKRQAYALVQEFGARFSERNGSVICRELLGCDLSLPDERLKAGESGLFETVCTELVVDAVEILEALIGGRQAGRTAPGLLKKSKKRADR